jgi:hypothetical protein
MMVVGSDGCAVYLAARPSRIDQGGMRAMAVIGGGCRAGCISPVLRPHPPRIWDGCGPFASQAPVSGTLCPAAAPSRIQVHTGLL